jgi:two-component system, chemotaxis family, chemotaxis protein CheY
MALDRSTLKILIVDDHPVTLGMLKQVLKQLGFRDIKEADNGQRALAIIFNENIGLVLTDLTMPVMSGVELIQEIRKKDSNRKIPVIVVSGENDPNIVMQAIKAGADAYVVKPFSAKTIGDKIVQVFSKRA